MNVLLPAYAAIAVVFGLAAHEVLQAVSYARLRYQLFQAFAYGVLGFQLLILIYNPLDLVPSSEDRAAEARVLDTISGIEGNVLVIHRAYLPSRVGKQTYAHEMALSDVMRGSDGGQKEALVGQMRDALAQRRFSAILADTVWFLPGLHVEIEKYYSGQLVEFGGEYKFWPVPFQRRRPEILYRPRE